ncbi:MAG: choice-of-anchor L domain-containing protein [Flavobacteriales bacterium]|nr:choice-of-anchor L domain-containing protein [Flavobacteriales bacterium]
MDPGVRFRSEWGDVSFNFVFASEEYPGYVCGTVNDAFGFFISGPGITGPFSNGAANIALIPGTTVPVTINSVNSGVVGPQGGIAANCAAIDPNWLANSIYYVDNGNANNPDPTAIRYNGRTVMMTASSQVQCGQQYHEDRDRRWG